jgi:uncharacterized protein (DUF433 family)
MTGTAPRNTVLHGDCITLMRRMPSTCVDFVLNDPPYVTRHRPRDRQTVKNDDIENTPFTKPVDFHSWRQAYSQALADANVSFHGRTSQDSREPSPGPRSPVRSTKSKKPRSFLRGFPVARGHRPRPRHLAGQPVIRGTRVPVRVLLGYLAHGETTEHILAEFPSLSEEHVRARDRICGGLSR